MSDYIPFEILVEIIKLLPIKSVIQCRCVSKSWKSFIDSTSFIADYTVRSRPHPHHLLITYDNMSSDSVEQTYVSIADDNTFPQNKCSLTAPPSVNRLKESSIIGTSHGLVCLFGYYQNPGDFNCLSGTAMAVIWNPSIRKVVAVDLPLRGARTGAVSGFGVCPVTCDPKIIYINDTRKKLEGVSCSSRWRVEVFSLSSGVWRSSYGNLPSNFVEFVEYDSSVTIDGSINWLARNVDVIISFDLSTEEFKEICFSNVLYVGKLFLLKLNDSLALVSVDPITDICKVWIMENGDSGSFVNRFTVNAPFEPVARVCVPLEFRRNGELVIMIIDRIYGSRVLVACEPFSQQINEVGIKGYLTSVGALSYTESLILLDR